MRFALAAIVTASVAVGFAGCRSQPRYEPGTVDIDVEASSNSPVVGDTVTLSAQTENIYGRSPKIRWEVPRAKVKTQDGGRVARVTFDEPGTYTATAFLTLNDGTEIQDSTQIVVGRVP